MIIEKIPSTSNPAIYALVNLENGKCYIGKSKIAHKRILDHLSKLNNGNHEIEEMQIDYNKNIFKIVILKEFDKKVNEKTLSNEEQLFIALYQSHKKEHGYNTVCTLSIFEPDDVIKIMQQKEINELINRLEKTIMEAKETLKKLYK